MRRGLGLVGRLRGSARDVSITSVKLGQSCLAFFTGRFLRRAARRLGLSGRWCFERRRQHLIKQTVFVERRDGIAQAIGALVNLGLNRVFLVLELTDSTQVVVELGLCWRSGRLIVTWRLFRLVIVLFVCAHVRVPFRQIFDEILQKIDESYPASITCILGQI